GAWIAALAARWTLQYRNGHVGDAVSLHIDVAEVGRLPAADFHLQPGSADLLAQHGNAVLQRSKLGRAEIERWRRRDRNGSDLDVADVLEQRPDKAVATQSADVA